MKLTLKKTRTICISLFILGILLMLFAAGRNVDAPALIGILLIAVAFGFLAIAHRCPSCGTVLRLGEHFCHRCGEELREFPK